MKIPTRAKAFLIPSEREGHVELKTREGGYLIKRYPGDIGSLVLDQPSHKAQYPDSKTYDLWWTSQWTPRHGLPIMPYSPTALISAEQMTHIRRINQRYSSERVFKP